MWALAHPLRFRLFELLAEEPSTASRLAERLGESRGSTSYHLRRLARTGAIVEDRDRGTRRERWWLRPDRVVVIPTDADVEGRAISARMLSIVFAREDEARRRFIAREVDAAWHENAFAGNWFLELTPEEANDLGLRLRDFVLELRQRPDRPAEAATALVAVSVLPWLEPA